VQRLLGGGTPYAGGPTVMAVHLVEAHAGRAPAAGRACNNKIIPESLYGGSPEIKRAMGHAQASDAAEELWPCIGCSLVNSQGTLLPSRI
jgi:hypothetical protein